LALWGITTLVFIWSGSVLPSVFILVKEGKSDGDVLLLARDRILQVLFRESSAWLPEVIERGESIRVQVDVRSKMRVFDNLLEATIDRGLGCAKRWHNSGRASLDVVATANLSIQ
jgi:hypothetical protein